MQAPNALPPIGVSQAPSQAHACCACCCASNDVQAQKSVAPPSGRAPASVAASKQPGVPASIAHAVSTSAVEWNKSKQATMPAPNAADTARRDATERCISE